MSTLIFGPMSIEDAAAALKRKIRRLRHAGWTLAGLARVHGLTTGEVARMCGEGRPVWYGPLKAQIWVPGGEP